MSAVFTLCSGGLQLQPQECGRIFHAVERDELPGLLLGEQAACHRVVARMAELTHGGSFAQNDRHMLTGIGKHRTGEVDGEV